MAIEKHCNETQTRWDHGEFQVRLESPRASKPIGYCEGTDADEREIHEQARREGAEIEISKKTLKTGREIWTIETIAEI